MTIEEVLARLSDAKGYLYSISWINNESDEDMIKRHLAMAQVAALISIAEAFYVLLAQKKGEAS